MADRFPTGVWINDGHRAEVFGWEDDYPQLGEFEVSFFHPRECPPAREDPYHTHMRACPLDWEAVNVGLDYPGSGMKFRSDNWDQEIPDEWWRRFFAARDGRDWEAGFPIEYYYEAGWTPSTPYWPSEYEWIFCWRPVELGRLWNAKS